MGERLWGRVKLLRRVMSVFWLDHWVRMVVPATWGILGEKKQHISGKKGRFRIGQVGFDVLIENLAEVTWEWIRQPPYWLKSQLRMRMLWEN